LKFLTSQLNLIRKNLLPFNIAENFLLGAIINFIIIAFVVFLIAKYLLKEEKVAKK